MAKTINSKKKLCKVMSNGPIAELGFISGPITSPCRIDIRKIINMVHRGLKVYEINPKNYSEQVLLTIKNVSTNNFPEPDPIKYPTEPVVKPIPNTVKDEQTVVTTQDNVVAPTPAVDALAAILEKSANASTKDRSEQEVKPVEELKTKIKTSNDFTKK